MSFFQENKAVTGLLAVGGVIFLGGLGLSVANYLSLNDAKAKFAAAEKNYLKLATETKPSPDKDNTARLQATLAKAQEVYEKQQGILFGNSGNVFGGQAPADSAASLFNLKSFVTKQNQLFTQAGFPVDKAAEFFGFDHYLLIKQDGPSAQADIAKVHQQRQVVERVLNHLLASAKRESATKEAPEKLLLKSVRRTRVEQPDEGKDAGGLVKGIFNIAPEVTARVENVVDTVGFEFVFVAKTETLRRLVNLIVVDQVPWVIRSVEVKRFEGEPGVEAESAPSGGTQYAEVIKNTYSQFTLTLEVISLVPKTATPASEKAPEGNKPASK